MADHSPQVALRLQQDKERARLSDLDRKDGQWPSRLYLWSVQTFYEWYWPGQYRIDFGLRIAMQYGKLAVDEKGIWNMARTAGSKNKSTVAKELQDALQFISLAANKEDQTWQKHCVLYGGFAIGSNGQISAGYPIREELEACPHLGRLKAAIGKTGKSLAIVHTEGDKLNIKGDKLTATVDCLPLAEYPFTQPDANIAKVDDKLKLAFEICGKAVSETGLRMVECAMLLEANQCTACDGKVLIQYWHGIDLPPNLVIPKIFAALVCRVKTPLAGFGFTPGRSVTLYFEDGAWLKTLLYEDEYPTATVNGVINAPTTPVQIPPSFFEAVEAVAEFSDDEFKTPIVKLEPGQVKAFGKRGYSAAYEIEGLNANVSFNPEYLKTFATFAAQADFTSYPDRIFFYGEKVRGIAMSCKTPVEPAGEAVREPEQAFRSMPERPGTQIDDDIPF